MAQSFPNLDNVQGDIWPGLSKKYEQFFFFQITSPDAFKPNLKRLLAQKKITTSSDAIDNRKMIAEHKQKNPSVLQEIAAVNIAFTFKGMKKMYPEDGFKDDPYRKGMEGDMVNEGRDKIQEWDDAFKASNGGVDGVFFVCGTEKKVKETTAELAKHYFNEARGIKHVITLDGRERDGENYKHEHFGYLDAISQPRLTGLDEQCKPGDGNYQFMCRPGRIIIGHDGEMGNEPKLMHGSWAKDGSYLVIRKYQQFVPEFNNYLKAESQKLHLTPDQLGARMMGRWKSGCPVELHPDQDNPALARMNEFNYNPESATNCPFAAHMRKVKPRIDNRDADKNDIMRRGIPYGPEVGSDEANATKLDRGLIFTCYQSSISNGFQEIQRQWINKSTFPDGKEDYIGDQNPGQDCIVGQLVGRPRNDRDKVLTTAICNGKGEHTSTSYTPFIQSHGGDYFFSPSISLLQAMTKPDF